METLPLMAIGGDVHEGCLIIQIIITLESKNSLVMGWGGLSKK